VKAGVPSYWGGSALDTTEVQHSYAPSSVADPGSRAFVTPGSRIPDPKPIFLRC
jgi:hypothetical protein